MKLCIDGLQTTALPNQTLLTLVKELGLDNLNFSQRPIAAKIAGKVFNLNYVPVRSQDMKPESTTIRRAMTASKGVVSLIRYSDPIGKDVYMRTAYFILFLALHNLWPDAHAKMNCTIGDALYVEVCSKSFSTEKLKQEIGRIVAADIPLLRQRVTTQSAIEYFTKTAQTDKARLLSLREIKHFDQYTYKDFADYYYGELAPSTGYMQVWDILPADGGFMFLFPDTNTPETVAKFENMPNFFQVCNEGERWCELMECETLADLNTFVKNGKIRELIRVNEALHEKRFSQVADMVCERETKVVMLAGPSSSGKTTSANRLATQLRVHGKKPILLSLDDYYIDRDTIEPGPDGKLDLEHINTIDTQLFCQHIRALLAGDSVEIPYFNFKTGKREWNGNIHCLCDNTVMIVEGLHALNPVLLPQDLVSHNIFKLYVSPILPLNMDDHNRIPTSLLRLLRRTVRDYRTRGASVQKTMEMWDSVRRGEKRWIFPYQECADVIFNSSTLYELAVLKKYIYPLLKAIPPEDGCFEQVDSLVKVLNYVIEADVDDEIPPTSLVREFIGGNSFYR